MQLPHKDQLELWLFATVKVALEVIRSHPIRSMQNESIESSYILFECLHICDRRRSKNDLRCVIFLDCNQTLLFLSSTGFTSFFYRVVLSIAVLVRVSRSANMSLISLCFVAWPTWRFWLVISQIVCLLLWGMIVSK